jgi:hypothetical protein
MDSVFLDNASDETKADLKAVIVKTARDGGVTVGVVAKVLGFDAETPDQFADQVMPPGDHRWRCPEPIDVRCPQCGAKPGEKCISPNGITHARRNDASITEGNRRRSGNTKKLPKQRKRREHVDAKAKPKPAGVGVTMTDSHGQWKRCPKCDGDLAHILPHGRRDECHRPRSEVIALRDCSVLGWRDSGIDELDLSGAQIKRLCELANPWLGRELTTVGELCDFSRESIEALSDEVMGSISEFKARIERNAQAANESRKRKAKARRDSEAKAQAVAP